MIHGSHRHTADDIWQHVLCVTVNDTIDAGKALVELAVDEAFAIALLGVGVNCAGVRDMVMDQVRRRGDKSGCHISTHDVDGRIGRVTGRDVAVSIDDAMIVEDVICRDELFVNLGPCEVVIRDC